MKNDTEQQPYPMCSRNAFMAVLAIVALPWLVVVGCWAWWAR